MPIGATSIAQPRERALIAIDRNLLHDAVGIGNDGRREIMVLGAVVAGPGQRPAEISAARIGEGQASSGNDDKTTGSQRLNDGGRDGPSRSPTTVGREAVTPVAVADETNAANRKAAKSAQPFFVGRSRLHVVRTLPRARPGQR